MSPVRQALQHLVDSLDDGQAEKLLQVAHIFYPQIATNAKAATETDEDFEYDVTKDPMVGFLSFPDDPNDATTVKEVVRRHVEKKFESLA